MTFWLRGVIQRFYYEGLCIYLFRLCRIRSPPTQPKIVEVETPKNFQIKAEHFAPFLLLLPSVFLQMHATLTLLFDLFNKVTYLMELTVQNTSRSQPSRSPRSLDLCPGNCLVQGTEYLELEGDNTGCQVLHAQPQTESTPVKPVECENEKKTNRAKLDTRQGEIHTSSHFYSLGVVD